MPATPLQAFAYAPLLPIAVAATLGLVLDRYGSIPIPFGLSATLLCLIAWAICRQKNNQLALIYLWASWIGMAASYHHAARNLYSSDDISAFAADEPLLVHVRGILDEEPTIIHRRKDDPLVSVPRGEPMATVLQLFRNRARWPVHPGERARGMHLDGRLDNLHVGDEIEAVGWLSRPSPPMNPGELDFASRLLDRRIRAELRVRKSADGIVRLNQGWQHSFFGWLAVVRGWGQRVIQEAIPPAESGIATALLLGEGSTMTNEDWEKYVRTGVIHVLAISGQHLVVLGAFLWLICRLAGVRRRRAALFIAVIMFAYALLTGGRPSAMRTAIMVGAICAGILLRRPAMPANTFALAWLVVIALNPTDLFTAGFQLSFLCVAVLIWGIPRWFPVRERTPMENLIDESRPGWLRASRAVLREAGRWYLITLVLTCCTAPLVMSWQNVISPAGVLIGPPAIFLTSIALIAGFMLILLSPLPWITLPCAWVTDQSIRICEGIVGSVDRLPGACWYVPNVPTWWLIGFYGILIGWMAAVRLSVSALPETENSVRFIPIIHPRHLAIALALWLSLGLALGAWKPSTDELRVTFLAVGHGGCTVIETGDGRVLLYDAGALSGPELLRRFIAPYLWQHGISRIDEVFVSHADLDHFNGLPALADRFRIGQITWTPSFAQKHSPGVAFVVQDLHRRGIAIREAKSGDLFHVGDVDLSVLHPPAVGPEGAEECAASCS